MEEPLRDPGIADGEVARYRGLVGGREAGTGTLRIEHAERDGRSFYRQLVSMTILGEAEYELEAHFRRRSGHVLADSYRLVTKHADEPFAEESARFRGVKTLQWGGVLEPFPGDLAPLLGCAVMLRGLDFSHGARRGFSVWLANTVHWPVEARVEGRETVSIAAGRLPAWPVRVWPSFERVAGPLDALVRMLLPPFRLHFAEAPPHRFLRFEFPTGPFRWNPHAVIEATALEGGDAD